MLEVKDLKYKYPDGHEALRGITLTLNEGEKAALVGANGSGKSTLLLHLAGALEVQEGRILFRGQEGIEVLRKNVGLIFQYADDQILMPTVLEDVSFSLVARGMRITQAHELSMNILDSLGIKHLAGRVPQKLSGGEKRMVSIAGVMADDPEVLILDEPAASLDPKARRRVIDFLKSSSKTILLASHDLDFALDVCSKAVIIREGVISAEGLLPEMFRDKELLESNGLELPLKFS